MRGLDFRNVLFHNFTKKKAPIFRDLNIYHFFIFLDNIESAPNIIIEVIKIKEEKGCAECLHLVSAMNYVF